MDGHSRNRNCGAYRRFALGAEFAARDFRSLGTAQPSGCITGGAASAGKALPGGTGDVGGDDVGGVPV